MAAALEDPLTQRFMTVSESCIPLYSPAVTYHQLMYSEKSRINACTTREDWGLDQYRYPPPSLFPSSSPLTLRVKGTLRSWFSDDD